MIEATKANKANDASVYVEVQSTPPAIPQKYHMDLDTSSCLTRTNVINQFDFGYNKIFLEFKFDFGKFGMLY